MMFIAFGIEASRLQLTIAFFSFLFTIVDGALALYLFGILITCPLAHPGQYHIILIYIQGNTILFKK